MENTAPFTYEPGTPNMEDDVQVAGLFDKASMLLRKSIKEAPAAMERTIVPDAARQAPTEVPVTKDISGVKVIPAAQPELVEKVGTAIKQRAETGNIKGLPPEEAFNLSRFQTDDAAAVVAGVSDALGIKTTKVTFDEIKSKATELGIDEKFLARLTDEGGGMMPNAVDTYRAMQVLESSANELDKLFRLVKEGTATESQKLQLRQQVAFHGLVQRGVKGIQSETARALAVFRIPRDANVDTIRTVLDEFGGDESLVDMANKYMTLDRVGRNQMVERSMMSAAKYVWLTTWMNGLLSLPVTHFKNVVGTNAFGLLQIPERAVGSFFSKVPDALRSGFKAEGSMLSKDYWKLIPGSAEEKIEVDEFLTMIASMRQGIPTALKSASRAFVENTPSDPLTKVEIQRGTGGVNPISSAAFGMQEDSWMAKGVDLYGKAITLPGRALMTEDEFAKSWMYHMEKSAIVRREQNKMFRSMVDAGIDEDSAIKQSSEFAEDLMRSPTQDIDDAAMDFARRGTFTAKLPTMLNKLQEMFNSTEVMGFPVLKIAVPFFKTPANIGLEVIERTPFAPISSRFRSDFMEGGVKRDMAMAKVSLGSTLMTTFAIYASEGKISGRGPERAADRQALERTGWKPYSIKVDDEWYTYSGLDPMSGLLAIAADYAEYARYSPDADAIEEVFLGGAFAIAHYMGEQPYLQGVADIAKLVDVSEPGMAKNILNQLGKQASSYVIGGSPVGAYGSMVAGIERMLDPTKKDTKAHPELPMFVRGFAEGFNKYRSRLPYFNADLPDMLNMWGDKAYEGSGAAHEMVLPTRVSPEQFSPADEVLINLGSPLNMKAFDKIDGVELTGEERNRLKMIYGKEIKYMGTGVKEAIVDAYNDPGFAALTLDQKQTNIRVIHERFMDAAKSILKQSPEGAELNMRIDKLKRNREAFGLYYKE
jgi:hypothetical protein